MLRAGTPPRATGTLQFAPTTPPNHSTGAPTNVQLTPEKVRRMELNRLKAKARQRELRERLAAESLSNPNSNNKRPLEVVPVSSASPTAPNKRAYERNRRNGEEDDPSKPLKKDTRLSNYFEYDLSKMVNTKGGFLVDEDGGPGKEMNEELTRKEKLREKERAEKNSEPFRMLDPAENPKCRECGSQDIDHIYMRTFRCLICNACKNSYPENSQDYILTDSELRDEEALPHLLKSNPHSATWNNMMLFVRYQVEEFAWKKWGSPEDLDKEFFRREELKRQKKGKKFERGLKELRRRTREGIWQKRKDEEHEHDFGPILVDEEDEDGIGRQRCKQCGFEIEVEEL
ncbi:hypothetical protein FRC20_009433 [Serendipita sp. 405]|nr:hypothetical protein FRC20_009433 [Serendipita sp. 405]